MKKVISLLFVIGISNQILAMEPETPKGGGNWFARLSEGIFAPEKENAVQIHIYDKSKRACQLSVVGEAQWNGNIKAFVVTEESMNLLRATYPGMDFYCNRDYFFAKLGSYVNWLYPLLGEQGAFEDEKNKVVYEPLNTDEATLVKPEIIEINRPAGPGEFFNANLDLPDGFWFKTTSGQVYLVRDVVGDNDIRRSFIPYQL